MKKLALLLSLFLLTCGVTHAQTDSTYKGLLVEMLKASGSEATFKASVGQMVTLFKQQKSDVPPAVWDELELAFTKNITADLATLLLPIYRNHLTEAELKDITAFYKSPSGLKLAQTSPAIVKESMEAGQQWGMKIGADLAQKLKDKGY
jgi:hypothetical protein